MKAVVLSKTGGVDVLKVSDVEMPEIGPHDCLVRIKYAGVNYADILSRQGLYNWQGKRPYILGLESSGVVDQIGNKVTKFKIGDRVVIGSKSGNYAEYIAKHEDDIFSAPDFLSFEELACLCGNWAPAWAALFEMARVRPGETALIHAGAGGVGTAAIQLATEHGMKVYATASSEKHQYVHQLGATPLKYGDFEKKLEAENPNFILESVGGKIHAQSLKILAPLGHMVSLGATGIKVNKLNLLSWYKAWRDYPQVSRSDLDNLTYSSLHVGFLLEDYRETILPVWNRMIAFMEEKNLKPVLQKDCVYPMSKASDAHALIDSRQNIGKLLLDPTR